MRLVVVQRSVVFLQATLFLLVLCLPLSGQAEQTSITATYYHWLQLGREKAGADLNRALTSKLWRERSHALLAVGKLQAREFLPQVICLLKNDPVQAVRNCAVLALADIHEQSTVPYLLTLLKKNVPVKRRVRRDVLIRALGRIGDGRAVVPIYTVFLQEPALRAVSTEALLAIADVRVSELILEDAEEELSGLPEQEAAVILGRLPVPGAEKFLLHLVRHRRGAVQYAAVQALGEMRARESVPVLLRCLESGDRMLVDRAAQALIRIDALRAVDPLFVLLQSTDPALATVAAKILARMQCSGIAEKVYELLVRESRFNALGAYVLGFKKYRPAARIFRKRLSDPGQPGQEEMARALGEMEDRTAIPLLMEVARRPDGRGAIWALGHMRARQALALLLKLLAQRPEHSLPGIISALGQMGDQRAVGPLIELFYESNFRYSLYIGLALNALGGSKVRSFIRDNLESGQMMRMRMACYMLRKSQDKTLLPYVRTLLDHPNKMVRNSARIALKRLHRARKDLSVP